MFKRRCLCGKISARSKRANVVLGVRHWHADNNFVVRVCPEGLDQWQLPLMV